MKKNVMLFKQQPTDGAASGGEKSPKTETNANDQTKGDNIEDQINKGTNINKEAIEAASAEIVKRNKERRKDESIRLLNRGQYTVEKQRLTLRWQRRKEEADKLYMTALGKLDVELREGKHDTASWKVEFEKAAKERVKLYEEADKIYRDFCKKLEQLYPEYYCYEWNSWW